MIGAIIFAAQLIYPSYLGFTHASFSHAAIYVLVLAVVLFFYGPKSQEVQHQPGKGMMFMFGLVLASGLTAIGYGVGYAIGG